MFYFFSKHGDAVGLAQRLHDQGEKVSFNILEEPYKDVAKGILSRKSSLPAKKDTIVFDSVGHGAKASRLTKRGFNVVGGSVEADNLELDREAGLEVMEESGVKVPQWFVFKNASMAARYVEKVKQPFAIKPFSNDLFSTVPKGFKATVDALRFYEKNTSNSLLLQKIIKGDEISTEAWFDNGKYIEGSANHTIEEKRFLAGNLGPQVGCVSSMVWKAETQDWMKKVGQFLPGYSGPVDLNSIVDKNGIWWGLEWTPRFGYSAIYALVELLQGSIQELLSERKISLRNGYAFALRVSVPPYPFESSNDALRTRVYKMIKGLPLGKIPDGAWLLDYMKTENGVVAAGVDGVIMEITSHGETPEQASSSVFEKARSLTLKDAQYRIDAADRANAYLNRKVPALAAQQPPGRHAEQKGRPQE